MPRAAPPQRAALKIAAFHTLHTVIVTGSLAKAAQALNLTPSAVSMQMRQLEDYMGTALFDRSGQTIKQMALVVGLLVILEVGARMQRHIVIEQLQVTALQLHRVAKLLAGHQFVEQVQRFDLRRREAWHLLEVALRRHGVLAVGTRGEHLAGLAEDGAAVERWLRRVLRALVAQHPCVAAMARGARQWKVLLLMDSNGLGWLLACARAWSKPATSSALRR